MVLYAMALALFCQVTSPNPSIEPQPAKPAWFDQFIELGYQISDERREEFSKEHTLRRERFEHELTRARKNYEISKVASEDTESNSEPSTSAASLALIEDLEAPLPEDKIVFRSTKERKQHIELLEQSLNAAPRQLLWSTPSRPLNPYEHGSWGIMRETLIPELVLGSAQGYPKPIITCKRLSDNQTDSEIWIQGRAVSPRGLPDRIFINCPAEVIDILTFTPEDKPKLIGHVVQLYNPEQFQQWINQEVPLWKQGKEPAPWSAKRTWKDASAKFTVEAYMLDRTETHVRLRKLDGTETSVPLAKLCEEDQKFAEACPLPPKQ